LALLMTALDTADALGFEGLGLARLNQTRRRQRRLMPRP